MSSSRSRKVHSEHHVCTLKETDTTGLPQIAPNASMFRKFLRFLRTQTLLKPEYTSSKAFFRNKSAKLAERKRHAKGYWFVIHPFSTIAFILQILFYMTWWYNIVFAYVRFFLPLRMKFGTRIFQRTMDGLQYFVMLSFFVTGYTDNNKKVICIEPKKIISRYARTFLIFDLIAVGLEDAVSLFLDMKTFKEQQFSYYYIVATVIMAAYLVRFRTLVHVLHEIMTHFNINEYIFFAVSRSMVILFCLNAFTCLFASIPNLIFGHDFPKRIFLVRANLHVLKPKSNVTVYDLYSQSLLLVTSTFFGLTYVQHGISELSDFVPLMLIRLFGRLFTLYTLADFLKVFGLAGLAESKYDQYHFQLHEYMKSKNLPNDLQQKVLTYYEFKMQGHFLNEKKIRNTISPILKNDLILFGIKQLMVKTPLLGNLGETALGALFAHAKVETYLPQDVIFEYGELLDYVYFVGCGTVIVYTKDEFELEHYIDGEEFAIVNIWTGKPASYKAVAGETTEIFKIHKKERLQQQLEEQAQRYEEQLTELHSVIAELTRKLHQQRSMAIAEEDEVSESCTSVHEESVTCPLEVSELEPLENDLSDIDNKIPSAESPLELPEPKLLSSQHETNESQYSEIVESLRNEISNLRHQLHDAHGKLAQMTLTKIEETADEETVTDSKNIESPESHIEIDCEPKIYQEEKADIKYSNIVPIHRTNIRNNAPTSFSSAPVTKMAERIKLKRATDGQRDISPNELLNSDLSTAVAEHIVGDILRQCDIQAEKQCMDIEMRKVIAKLEHARSQNTVLALTLSETKAHCDRLALLCGKYESNAIALRIALGISDRAIEAYDVLLALLETEIALKEDNPESVQNRSAAETVAKQLLHHLDSFESTDVLLSPWQNHVYSSPTTDLSESWTPDHELRLREHVSRLKAERSNIQGTYVTLESTQIENAPVRPSSSQEARKMDLEMAVLMQELMGLREDKAELISKLFTLEKEKCAMELKLKYAEGQHKAHSAALKNLQGQLKDTEALLAMATQNKERGYSDAEHAQGVELELMQALAREARLKVRLQELVTTLEQVTKNAEARLLEGREIVQDLNQTNSMLADTVDRNNKKYQAKVKKMEHQMLAMVEKHTAQVQNLQQKLATLDTPPTNSSESVNSVAV